MKVKPQKLSSESIYKGKIFDINIDSIREGDVEYKREIVVHKGSCVIIPVFDDGRVALVRQYRHAAGKYLLEICAGTLNAGEDPKTGAIRELEEEIGVTAGKIEKLCEFYVSPGFLTEKMFVYVATGLTEVGQKLESDEILTIERYSFDQLKTKIDDGEIEDAKTIIGLMLAGEKFQKDA
ncbi:MAG: NUDIX hydrolase [Pyrinomonadaceae bacterium]